MFLMVQMIFLSRACWGSLVVDQIHKAILRSPVLSPPEAFFGTEENGNRRDERDLFLCGGPAEPRLLSGWCFADSLALASG